jgi:hypothetical protein
MVGMTGIMVGDLVARMRRRRQPMHLGQRQEQESW